MEEKRATRWDGVVVELCVEEGGTLATGFVVPRRAATGWPCRRCALAAVDTLERVALCPALCRVEADGLCLLRPVARCVAEARARPATLCPAQYAYDTNWRVEVAGACLCEPCDERTWRRFVASHPAVVDAVTRATAAATRPFVEAVLPSLAHSDEARACLYTLFARTDAIETVRAAHHHHPC